jgi:carotenoid 1,2-hydratase
MNISTDFKDESPFPNKPSGAYEWWYFDALTNDKNWGIVAIFYEGNPFSPNYIEGITSRDATPNNFPAVSISIYHNKQTEYYSFKEYSAHDFEFNEATNEYKIGDCAFQRTVGQEGVSYTLTFDQVLVSGFSLVGQLTFKSPKLLKGTIAQKSSNDHHLWNLIQPQAEVKGVLLISGKTKNHDIEFEGLGYHDHNVGFKPMKDDFEDWYWGRFHFDDATLIYYNMNQNTGRQYQAWLFDNKDPSSIHEFTNIELKEEGLTPFGLRSSRVISLSSKEIQVHIQQSHCVDSGPFYQRFIAEAVLNNGESLKTSTGISEYIKPERIYNKIFWPAVRMRLQFMNQKAHWVQKSKRLYPWTW